MQSKLFQNEMTPEHAEDSRHETHPPQLSSAPPASRWRLPLLEVARAPAAPAAKPPRRMVCINTPLGLHPAAFFPEKAGKDYALSPYLEVLKDFRDDFTVISGLSHPDVGPSHDSNYSFLTGAPHPEQRAGFRNSISLDQFAAEHLGGQTRFASLPLSCEGFGLSWTRSGAPVPPDSWPSSVFAKLFLEGRPDEVEAQARRLHDGQSILDAVGEQAKRLQSGARRRATARSSTSTSPASASWSSGWPRPRSGRRSPSRRSTPSRRRTSRTRPT